MSYKQQMETHQEHVRTTHEAQRGQQMEGHFSGGDGAGGIRIVAVIAEFPDYLSCKNIKDGVVTGTAFNVAKPYWHRVSSYDQLTIAGWAYAVRSVLGINATQGPVTEQLAMTPSWTQAAGTDPLEIEDGDLPTIKIVKRVKTGVFVDDKELLVEAIADGRAWAVLTLAINPGDGGGSPGG